MAEISRETRHMLKSAEDGNIEKYDQWIKRGAELFGEDKKGRNVLHFLVKKDKYKMLRHVINSQAEVTKLVNKYDGEGWSPLHLCCIQHPVSLKTLELLITVGGDPFLPNKYGNACKDLVDREAREFLHWRKSHDRGLPKDVQGLSNGYILMYLRIFGHLDDNFTALYNEVMLNGEVHSRDITVIILGPPGSGKTTVCRCLRGVRTKNVAKDNTEMYINRIMLDLTSGQRTDLGDRNDYLTCQQRIVDTVNIGQDDDPNVKRRSWLKRSLSVVSRKGQDRTASPTLDRPTESSTRTQRQKAYVSIFDLHGDGIYQNMNQALMTRTGVYILPFSLERYPNMSVPEDIRFWLNLISSYIEEDQAESSRVILVGTHLDKVPDTFQDSETITVQLKQQLRADPAIGDIASKLIKEIFLVKHTVDPTEVYGRIWEAIVESAIQQSHWGKVIPAVWLILQRELMRKKDKGHKFLSINQVSLMAKKLPAPVENEDEVKDFLRYMHECRSIICFSQASPDDVVILDPRWFMCAMQEIIAVAEIDPSRNAKDKQSLNEYGKYWNIDRNVIRTLWTKEGKEDLLQHMNYILQCMEQLALISEPICGHMDQKLEGYIIPSVLPLASREQMYPILEKPGIVRSQTLRLVFQNQFVPPAVLDSLLAKCIHTFEVLIDTTTHCPMLYRKFACFSISPGLNLALHGKNSVIKLMLFSFNGSKIQNGIGHIVLTLIETILKTVLSRNNLEHLTFCYYDNTECRVDILKKTPESEVWLSPMKQLPDKAGSCVSRSILDQSLDPKRMSHFAKYIGNSYAVFFAILGLPYQYVEQERERSQVSNFRTQIIMMFLRWKELEHDRATLQNVFNAMLYSNISIEAALLDPVFNKELPSPNEDATIFPETELSSCPINSDLDLISGVIGMAYITFFLELDLDYDDIRYALDLHQGQPVRVPCKHLLDVWLSKNGRKATFHRLIHAMKEAGLEFTTLGSISLRSSQC